MDKDKPEEKKEQPHATTQNNNHESIQKVNGVKQQKKQQKVSEGQKIDEKSHQKPEEKHNEKPLQPEKSEHHEIDFNHILAVFYAKEEISEENIAQIKHKISEDCSKVLLKQFKNSISKSIDSDQKQFTLEKYRQWIIRNKKQKKAEEQKNNQKVNQKPNKQADKQKNKQVQKENEKEKEKEEQNQKQPQKKDQKHKNKQQDQKQEVKNEHKAQQNKISKDEDQAKPKLKANSMKNNEDKFLNLLTKYFKPVSKQVHKCSPSFGLQINYSASSPLENVLGFNVRVIIGQKQITQLQTQLESKKIITPKPGKEYLVFQIETKKGEILEELIEQNLKDKKINVEGFEFKTNTDEKHLYIGLGYENENENSRLRKINSIFQGSGTQQNCKIEMVGKFGLGNEGKNIPEERKFIKCISKGFQFKFNVSGSSGISQRFRKNIQIENSESMLYSLLAITKSSQFKLKLKKMEDVNIFFNKLGILEAVKTTPSIKEVLNDYLHQLFQLGTHETFDISFVLSLILKEAESTKISISKFNSNTLISANVSQEKNIGGIMNK